MVTIYEIAKAAKVSPKTAARILSGANGRGENKDRVLAAAERLGYVRNQGAANLRSGRSGLVGVIIPDISNPFYPEFYQSLYDRAVETGYQILLHSTFGHAREERQALHMFEMNRVEGIILNASEGEADESCDPILQRFIQRGVPLILAGRPRRNLIADEIVIRNVKAVEKAVVYLAKTGHKHIAFITGQDNMASAERESGFRKAMKRVGLKIDPNFVSRGRFTAESGLQQTASLLQLRCRPTAIVAANDYLALGAVRAIHSAGLSVPKDVAVIGFDDVPLASLSTPALTTLRQPSRRIASDCFERLLQRINDPQGTLTSKQFFYEPELIIRESA
jgi:DNA-binding LacI/PurR family transcriptional regulator